MSIVLGGTVVEVDPPVVPTIRQGPPSATSVVALPVVGPPGPAGPAGTSGGYAHIQTSAAATWTIAHHLGAYPPAVILLDTAPTVPVWTDITYPDANTVVLTFPTPVAGRAYL